ncbi:hypothetical protein Purlil1_7649 [Purpureocillium lilacinum]|uniref:Uncharacterized protein n=1 Tax=Purpureocillium lilacinum TaxID=33203 RepID=A0ABR0BVI5_PURLI|nr:hypothetical protein Purlil1_7649 [Purpureocillium lilacinum]
MASSHLPVCAHAPQLSLHPTAPTSKAPWNPPSIPPPGRCQVRIVSETLPCKSFMPPPAHRGQVRRAGRASHAPRPAVSSEVHASPPFSHTWAKRRRGVTVTIPPSNPPIVTRAHLHHRLNGYRYEKRLTMSTVCNGGSGRRGWAAFLAPSLQKLHGSGPRCNSSVLAVECQTLGLLNRKVLPRRNTNGYIASVGGSTFPSPTLVQSCMPSPEKDFPSPPSIFATSCSQRHCPQTLAIVSEAEDKDQRAGTIKTATTTYVK